MECRLCGGSRRRSSQRPGGVSRRSHQCGQEMIRRWMLKTTILGPTTQHRLLVVGVLMCLFGGSLAASRSVIPYFIREPSSELVYLNNRPRKVSCVVELGVEANIICNNRPLSRRQISRSNVTEGLEVWANIGYEYVRQFGSRISCCCIATKLGSPDKRVYRSRCVQIVRPFLGKNFGINPRSQRVAKGTMVRLRCEPPPGDPKPNVFWIYKSDAKAPLKRIRNSGGRYQLAKKTDLIMRNIQVSDSGYYTCVATNSASYRYSAKAKLSVFDNTVGRWSQWSEWTKCSSGISIRTRNCQSNRPSNCKGLSTESRRCSVSTPAPVTDPVSYVLPTTTKASGSTTSFQYSLNIVVLATFVLHVYITPNYSL